MRDDAEMLAALSERRAAIRRQLLANAVALAETGADVHIAMHSRLMTELHVIGQTLEQQPPLPRPDAVSLC